jgi:hypothetical protein
MMEPVTISGAQLPLWTPVLTPHADLLSPAYTLGAKTRPRLKYAKLSYARRRTSVVRLDN